MDDPDVRPAISGSVDDMEQYDMTLWTDGVTWLEGRRFNGNASISDVQSWVDSLDWNG